MTVQELERIASLEVISHKVAPAAALGFAARAPVGKREFVCRVAAAGTLPNGPCSPSTIFDLASISKPLTALCAVRLSQAGVLDLGAPLAAHLEEARGTPSAEVPLELCLAHRSGLEAHRRLFAPLFANLPFRRAEALRQAARARRADAGEDLPMLGFAPVYSDLGYLLVGAVLERLSGLALDELIAREVSLPLGLEIGSARALRKRRADFDWQVAPTEVVRPRGGALRGVVHDENAWSFSGHAASGHAGQFGTVQGVLGLGAAVLDAGAGRSAWLSKRALEPLLRRRPGGTLRAGFDGKSDAGSSAGERCSQETFGHLGFTGTSLWCDPVAEIVTVLLTNRVCPTRENAKIRLARPRVHDALFELATGRGRATATT